VRTGTKYSVDYVRKLRDGIAGNTTRAHDFVCLTDRPGDLLDIQSVDISEHRLSGWWGKMALLDFASRSANRVIFFDLDMVICGSLDPLTDVEPEFGICGSFTRAAGNAKWPCRYGSCVMSFAPFFGLDGWDRFNAGRDRWIGLAGIHGDQWVFEGLYPAATILQDVLPPGFFVGYRDFTDRKPDGCAVAVFAGKVKPHDCKIDWIAKAWG
jgi:hypothetical protein